MSDKIVIGGASKDFDASPLTKEYSKVIFHVDDETDVVVGDDTGRTMELDCPFGTEQIAQELLEKLKGYQYQPFNGYGSIVDPSAEVGDEIEANGVNGVLYRQDINMDSLFSSDISAPNDGEIDHEFPYKPVADRAIKRKFAKTSSEIRKTNEQIQLRVTSEQAQSMIDQTVDSISLSVGDNEGTTSFQIKKGEVVVDTETVDLHVKSVNVDGTLTADQIRGGTFRVGGDTGQYAQIIAYGTDGKPHGFYRSDGLFFAEDATTIGGALTWISQRGISVGDGIIHPIIAGETRAFFGVDERNKGQIYLIDTSASSPTNGFEARGDGTVKCKTLYINDELMSDLCVGRGTYQTNPNGEHWTWKKYASGDAECWGKFSTGTMTMTESGNVYLSDVKSVNFPDGLFNSVPDCLVNVQASGGLISAKSTGTTTATRMDYQVVRSWSGTDGTYIVAHCFGSWK